MGQQELLTLAALLHDIGKFRKRANDDNKTHQEHSHAFVTDDFGEFFIPCGDDFKNAILNHHPDGENLIEKQVIEKQVIEKQVILADRFSANESNDEDTTASALVSILSRLKGAKNTDKTFCYPITALDFEKPDTVIPTESADVNQEVYASLWEDFKTEFGKATKDKHYTPAHFQTIVALLHKYTSRMPSETANPDEADISLYDHLRTTAGIAACLGRELTDETELNSLLVKPEELTRPICALIKGDISGIQDFLYHILSDGASNQLRGRSFYLQLLTEAIAHWILKELNLPITNLILASGGHFYILAPYSSAKERMSELHQTVSCKLWTLHGGELSCILDYTPVTTSDFVAENFSNKWSEVAEKAHQWKQKKWAEMGNDAMFQNLFEKHENKRDRWQFIELGRKLRKPKYLITFDVPETPIPDRPNWHDAIKAFGFDVCIIQDVDEDVEKPEDATSAAIHRVGDTDFLANKTWEGLPVSYDFRLFRPVVGFKKDQVTIADYNHLAEASEGVDWFGALRMDVDDLGNVFIEKLGNASISRLATLSEALRLFFEGYIPEFCSQYNQDNNAILELIYAGGDDLFLVGGWSALPVIAEKIRSEFREFVTGDHITLSGGIAIEHQKFPLYQFADLSGDAEKASKNIDEKKNAITFLRKTMKWEEFAIVREWHQKLYDVLKGNKPLPRDILTRLSQIYLKKERNDYRWAWRSLYYFHRLKERNKNHTAFINKLQNELNNPEKLDLKPFIHVITRWTTLRIRK